MALHRSSNKARVLSLAWPGLTLPPQLHGPLPVTHCPWPRGIAGLDTSQGFPALMNSSLFSTPGMCSPPVSAFPSFAHEAEPGRKALSAPPSSCPCLGFTWNTCVPAQPLLHVCHCLFLAELQRAEKLGPPEHNTWQTEPSLYTCSNEYLQPRSFQLPGERFTKKSSCLRQDLQVTSQAGEAHESSWADPSRPSLGPKGSPPSTELRCKFS